MIEKKLNDKIEDTVAGAMVQKALYETPEDIKQPTQEQQLVEGFQDNPILQPPDAPPSTEPEPIQVAGLGSIMSALAKRTAEAEKKVVPGIPDEPVQEIGGQLIIRTDQAEVDDINRALGGNYIKGLNLPNIKGLGPEGIDAAAYLQNLKNINEELFEAQRRGTLNIDAIAKLAASKDLGNVVFEWSKRSPGEAANSEDLLAGLIGLDAVMKDTRSAWETAGALPAGPEREAATTRAMQLMNLEAHIAASLHGATSELGRGLYTVRSLQQAGLPDAARRLNQLYGLQDAQDIEHLGRLYMALPSPDQQVQFVKKGLFAKGFDAMIEIWVNSILTLPVTHMVNIAGNASFMALRNLETFAASGVGRVRSTITGNTDRVRAREAIAQLDGIRQGFMNALLVAGRTALTETPSDFASKIDVRNRRAIGTTGDPRVVLDEIKAGNLGAAAINVFGIINRLGGRALLVEDEFFKGIGYSMSIHQEALIRAANAYDDALRAGKSVDEAKQLYVDIQTDAILNPTSTTMKSAKEAARVMTFQGDLPGFFGDLQYAMSHPLIKLFIPFFKTPTNVMNEAFLRSPLALAYPSVRKSIMAGGREADMVVSRIATGSAIMGTFGYLSMGLYGEDNEMIILGAGPSDPGARAAMQRQGMQPYSVNLRQEDGTYKSITYSRLDPVSGILAMAADFAYYSQYEEDADTLDGLATALVLSINEYALQMPFLQGVQELGAALTNPDPTIKAEQLQKLFAEKLGSAALSTLPTVSSFTAGIERLQDPAARSTDLPPGKVPFTDVDVTETPIWAQGFYIARQKAMARNPFFSEGLPKDLNEWGEVRMQGTGAGWEFWSPIRIQNTKYVEVDAEMQRLGDGISITPNKIKGVRLNRDERLRWIELTNNMDIANRLPDNPDWDQGTTLLPMLNELVFSENYLFDEKGNERDSEEKMRIISNFVADRRSGAKDMLRMERIDLDEKINAVQLRNQP